MLATDKQVKDAIAAQWQAAATTASEPTRVITRWKLSLTGREVMQALRSLTQDKLINGVYISRIKASRKKVGRNHWDYTWVYVMYYFRSYDEGTDSDNSEDKMNSFLETVADQLADNPDLGLGNYSVDNHDELQIETIDTMDLKVHAAQCLLTVHLTKQGA